MTEIINEYNVFYTEFKDFEKNIWYTEELVNKQTTDFVTGIVTEAFNFIEITVDIETLFQETTTSN